MLNASDNASIQCRTAFISDVHLGYRACNAEHLLDFLNSLDCEHLYLVGDIVDIESMRRRFYWPKTHELALRKILDMARRGTRVVYVPGNHDVLLRDYVGSRYGNVRIINEALHVRADGRRLLVLHGDRFDNTVSQSRAVVALGSLAYGVLLGTSNVVFRLRYRLGLRHWSLATSVKSRLRSALDYVERFERAAASEARWRGVDGIVCGHIHRPKLEEMRDVLYANCGDWVESCTALIEHHDGALELLHWPGALAAPSLEAAAA